MTRDRWYSPCPLCGGRKGRQNAVCNDCRYSNPDVCIWPRVDRSGGPDACWEWVGRRDRRGYGVVTFRGSLRAHQATYRMAFGDVPSGYELDHLCRNTSCVNPSHLEAVTHHENLSRSPLMGGWETTRKRPTRCPAGHDYDERNTRVYGGKRQCVTCGRERKRAGRALVEARRLR